MSVSAVAVGMPGHDHASPASVASGSTQSFASLINVERYSIDRIAGALGENVGVVKNMVFKKRGLLNFQPDEIKSKIQQLADIVEVRVQAFSRPHLRYYAYLQVGALQFMH